MNTARKGEPGEGRGMDARYFNAGVRFPQSGVPRQKNAGALRRRGRGSSENPRARRPVEVGRGPFSLLPEAA